jgi:hypothetical protein
MRVIKCSRHDLQGVWTVDPFKIMGRGHRTLLFKLM